MSLYFFLAISTYFSLYTYDFLLLLYSISVLPYCKTSTIVAENEKLYTLPNQSKPFIDLQRLFVFSA